jgi:threonine dehydrogenase-like Zn-dependent dehydrogenase
MKTRQAVLVEPGKFEIQETDVAPGPGDVLVKTEGSGLCTYELNHWAGRLGTPPMALGHEGYGTVVEIGEGVSSAIQMGDRVTGLAGKCFSDYFTLPECHLMPINKDVDQKHIPGEPLYCVHNVVRAAHPEIGDCVAVVGCGPMGLWAIQALAYPSLQALIAVDIDDTKLELAKKFGATHTVNPKNSDPEQVIEEITNGKMIDVAVEGTGGPGTAVCIKILRPRNPRLVIMSSFKGPQEIDMVMMCGKAIDMVCAHPGIQKDREDGCRRTATLINNGVFKTDDLISHQFRLEDIMTAFETLENRVEGYMKGIVVP